VDVYVSVDMEGVAGVFSREQAMRGDTDAYRRACRLMTEEANAAVAGAMASGAQRVIVNDAHGRMNNLDPELLDRRAECSAGHPKPYSMMAGIGPQFGAALFVGYHAGAGSAPAIMDHTLTPVLRGVRLNGARQTEATLNAALAGHFGVPVALVTGDEAACAEATAALGANLATVVTKAALGCEAAYSLHPAVARERIEVATREGLARVAAGRIEPFRVEPPYVLDCDLCSTLAADYTVTMPGTERSSGRTVRYRHDDYPTVFRALLSIAMLGGLASA
jgi:D-amino peptidase